MAKTIKFDLPIDGCNVASLEDLRGHFTIEIIKHFRDGVLARWLRSRGHDRELESIEKIAAQDRHDDSELMFELCKLFDVEADRPAIAADLAKPTSISGAHLGPKQFESRSVSGRVSGELAHNGEDRWQFEVPNAACVKLGLTEPGDVIFSLESEHGRQIALHGFSDHGEELVAILSKGTYFVRLWHSLSLGLHYELHIEQAQEVSVESSLPGEEGESLAVSIRHHCGWGEKSSTLSAGRADLWVIGDTKQNYEKKKLEFRSLGRTSTVGYLLVDGFCVEHDSYGGTGQNFRIRHSRPLQMPCLVLVKATSSYSAGPYELRVTEKESKDVQVDPLSAGLGGLAIILKGDMVAHARIAEYMALRV